MRKTFHEKKERIRNEGRLSERERERERESESISKEGNETYN